MVRYKETWKSLVLSSVLLLMAVTAYGQQITVQGTVTDAQTGDPLVGVNILVVGTSSGTTTDTDGNYSLSVPSLQDSLRFSYIGFQTQTVAIDGRSTINIALKPTILSGQQMVVIGYGTEKRKNLVSAVTQIEPKGLASRPTANLASSLKGSIPGLYIKPKNGNPASTPQLDIRGFNSLNGGSPLVLVDGIKRNIQYVNPNNVKSVSVLKGVAASAIYGSRGAFGVILITTKNAAPGSFKVNYSNNFGFTTNTTRTDFLTNPYLYARTVDNSIHGRNGGTYYKNYDQNDWEILKRVSEGKLKPFMEKQPNGIYKFYEKTNWWRVLNRKWRPSRMNNVSISGGSKKINGYFSARTFRHLHQQKIQPAHTQKYNIDLKLNFQPFKWLKFTGASKFARKFDEAYAGNTHGWGGGVYGYRRWHNRFVNYPVTFKGLGVDIGREGNGALGSYGAVHDGGHTWRKAWNNRRINTIKMNLIPIKQLSIKANYTYKSIQHKQTNRLAPFQYYKGSQLVLTTGGHNQLYEQRLKTQHQYLKIFGTYSQDLKRNHFKLLLGFNWQQLATNGISATKKDLLTVNKSNLNLGTMLFNAGGQTVNWATLSYFGRLNYNYRNTYLLEINARYDGSSRFPKGSQWGLFPSIGVGWRVSNEKFWTQSIKDIVSSLKVRASFGKLGNQDVPINTFIPTLRVGKNNWLVNGKELLYARVPKPLPESVGWEDVISYDFGMDVGFLDNKVTATLDFYQRSTKNMYLPGKPLPAVFGAKAPKRNYASLRNRGFELSVGYNNTFNVFGSTLSLNVQANVSNFKSVITKFDNPKGLLSTFYEGEVLGTIWGYHILGQFQSDKQAAKYQTRYGADNLIKGYRDIFSFVSNKKWDHLKAGDIIYADINGDGKIDKGNNTLKDHGDLERIGNTLPKFPFGFNIHAAWRNLDITVIGQGIAHEDWYPNGPIYWGPFNRPYENFIRKDLLAKMWNSSIGNNNSKAFYPQVERPYSAFGGTNMLANVNDYYLTNIGYLRIRNLTIGYTLPTVLTQSIHVSKLRIFISAENIFTIRFGGLTKYMDPEVAASPISYSNPNSATKKSANDTLPYPIGKTYSIGINLHL